MKSRVTKLFDYTRAEVPEKLRRWRVTDQAMEEHLAVLGRSHALERDVDEVRAGDSVVCRGESEQAGAAVLSRLRPLRKGH